MADRLRRAQNWLMTSGDPAPPGPLAVSRDGPVATVTIGTGRRHNALTSAAWLRLADCVAALSGDDSLAAVLLRGAGRTFCSGSDVSEWIDADPVAVEASFAHMEAAFRAIETCPVPVLASVAGVAAGAGCQLALACDLRIMSASARIGMPIARLGIRPSPAFAARLIRLAGPARAAELLYTGRLLRAPQALAAGLTNHVVPQAELAARGAELLAEITRNPPSAVRAAKQAVIAAAGLPPSGALGPAADYPDLQLGIARILNPG